MLPGPMSIGSGDHPITRSFTRARVEISMGSVAHNVPFSFEP